MIGVATHTHANVRGYSRPAPDLIVASAQSWREGSAGIGVPAPAAFGSLTCITTVAFAFL